MKVTQTRYGVTLRNILMGLGSDQVRVQNPSACLPEHGHSTAVFVLFAAEQPRHLWLYIHVLSHVHPGWTADGLGAAAAVAIRCTRWTSASLTLARRSTLT